MKKKQREKEISNSRFRGKTPTIRGLGIIIILSLAFYPSALNAQIIQNLGPNRDGKFNEFNLLKEWPEKGPELVLQINNAGKGWSAAVANSDKIFVSGLTDSIDFISAYNFKGDLLWRSSFGRAWMNSYPDTRSTPTVENEKVWVISGAGELACFNTENGEKHWSVNVDEQFEAEWDIWGTAESPLIVNNLVITVPAGKQTAMLALNKNTGETVWKTNKLSGNRSYVSPVLYKRNRVELIIGMTSEVLFAVNPKTGKVAWQFQFRQRGEKLENNGNKWPIYANNPNIIENKILISAGWDYGSVLFEISNDGKSIKELWVNRDLDNQQYGVVEHNGYIYGSNWLNMKNGNWVCIDLLNGDTQWETTYNNKGVVVLADNLFILYDEEGFVSLIEPSSKKLNIISKFKINEGKEFHWAHPFINDGKLFIRHGNFVNVYNIRSK